MTLRDLKIDGALLILAGGIGIFSGLVLFCALRLKEDGQTFQVFSNILSGFVGALLLKIKGTDTKSESTTQVTDGQA